LAVPGLGAKFLVDGVALGRCRVGIGGLLVGVVVHVQVAESKGAFRLHVAIRILLNQLLEIILGWLDVVLVRVEEPKIIV
jgi:hypothetical protein